MQPLQAYGVLGVLLVSAWGASAGETSKPNPGRAAFERLKGLAGEWQGSHTQPDGPAASATYRVASGGSVVMETLFPGSDHEMISMYHLDGEDLVLTHYCAMANQPRLRLDTTRSAPDELRFAFDGGANIDPSKSRHIHSGRLAFKADGRLEAEWDVYSDGRASGANKLYLTRKSAR